MGWKVRGSNPGVGENLRTRPARPWNHPVYYTMNYVIPWGFIGRIVALTIRRYLAPK
jgi:hypothetical protein